VSVNGISDANQRLGTETMRRSQPPTPHPAQSAARPMVADMSARATAAMGNSRSVVFTDHRRGRNSRAEEWTHFRV
jgi:hypothetical protein